jgi:hypothetical protein
MRAIIAEALPLAQSCYSFHSGAAKVARRIASSGSAAEGLQGMPRLSYRMRPAGHAGFNLTLSKRNSAMTSSKPRPKEPSTPEDPVRDAGGGNTKIEQGGDSAPRLPHEHDQSSDSQEAQDGQPPEVGRRGHDDIERGTVDTDRGPVADRVYNDKVKR